MSLDWTANPSCIPQVTTEADIQTSTTASNTSSISSAHHVGICSYNALAQSMIRREVYPYASHSALKLASRRELFTQQAVAFDQIDICSMQEVDNDQVETFWRPLFESKGFVVRFLAKREKTRHGLMIAYRESMFVEKFHRALFCEDLRLDAREVYEFSETDKPNCVQILALEFRDSAQDESQRGTLESNPEGKSLDADPTQDPVTSSESVDQTGADASSKQAHGIIISNTHLCWRYQLGYTKLRQVHYLLTAMDAMIGQLLPRKFIPVLTGDWNCTTNTLPYCIIRTRGVPTPFPVRNTYCHYDTLLNTLLNGETTESRQLDQETRPLGSRIGDKILLDALQTRRLPYPTLRLDMFSPDALEIAVNLMKQQGVDSYAPSLPDRLSEVLSTKNQDADLAQLFMPTSTTETLPPFLASDFFFACGFPGFLGLSEYAEEYLCLLPRHWQVIIEDDIVQQELVTRDASEDGSSDNAATQRILFWRSNDNFKLSQNDLQALRPMHEESQRWRTAIIQAEHDLLSQHQGWKSALESAREMRRRVSQRVQHAIASEELFAAAAPAPDPEHNEALDQAAQTMSTNIGAYIAARKAAEAKTMTSVTGAAQPTPKSGDGSEEQSSCASDEQSSNIPEVLLLERLRPEPAVAAKIMLQRLVDTACILEELRSLKHLPTLTSAYHWYRHAYDLIESKTDANTQGQPCPCYPTCTNTHQVHLDGPSFTTYTPFFAGALDCIYVPLYESKITAVAKLPQRTEIDRSTGLPSPQHPSDHLRIAVTLDV